MPSQDGGAGPWRDRLKASAERFVPGTRPERWALFLLLLLALVLRFWGFPGIPYTHDEISALVRVDFPTLNDAISKGVWNIDTHPPGTHAFLWVWTRIFGFGDGVVKLPFMLMSVLALFCLYRFAHAWAGAGVALIALALLATLQYTVMYGQIARPYAMGFFASALLADQLTRYIGSGGRRNLVLMGFAAVLSAYTHHFALMLAGLICGTGFFLIDRSRRKAFLIMAAAAVLCYLPNGPLFFAQLGWKGLDEWLKAPGAGWLVDYAWWIAHCSALCAVVISGLLLGAMVLRIRSKELSLPLLSITLVWGLVPLIIGYAYSVLRSPVLQYSVLLFSFPYLLIGALAGWRHLEPRKAMIIAGLAACVSVFTLVKDRQHYAVFNQSKYEAIVRGTQDAEKAGALAIVDMPPEVMAFYRKLWCITPSQAPFLNLRHRPTAVLDSALEVTVASMVFYGQTTQAEPENVAKVQARFPFLTERKDRYEGQTFFFRGRPDGASVDDLGAEHWRTPDVLEGSGWEVDAGIPVVVDTAGYMPVGRWDFTGHEYGMLYEGPVQDLTQGPNDVIEVRVDLAKSDPMSDLAVVVELKDGDSTLFYRHAGVADALALGRQQSLFVAVKLADVPGVTGAWTLRAYLHNTSRRSALVDRVGLRVREGDPVLYGFFRPIAGNWRFR